MAAGRRIIGAPKPGEETEQGDNELPEPPAPPRRAGRIGGGHEEPFMSPAPSNGHASENIAHPVAEPIVDDEEIVEPEVEEILDEEPDYQDEGLEDTDIPDMDLTSPEEEEEDFYDEDLEEDEEEDEDDLGWGGRGRKRNKPTRAAKQPPRKPKREPRRGY